MHHLMRRHISATRHLPCCPSWRHNALPREVHGGAVQVREVLRRVAREAHRHEVEWHHRVLPQARIDQARQVLVVLGNVRPRVPVRVLVTPPR